MKPASKSQEKSQPSSTGQHHMPLFYDESTKEKIARHLNDINDRISEEDIRNIDTNITIGNIKGSKAMPPFDPA